MSAAIVQYWHKTVVEPYAKTLPRDGSGPDRKPLTLIGWDYGQPLPEIPFGEEIIVVDLCLPVEKMNYLSKVTALTWIDHHDSSIHDMAIAGLSSLSGVRFIHKAACELTWKYFFPLQSMPKIVHFLGRYDCFGHKGTPEEEDIMAFQYGARFLIHNPEEAYSYLTDKDEGYDFVQRYDVVDRILSIGRPIYQYLCKEAKQVYEKKQSFLYAGVKIAAVNKERFNPATMKIEYHRDGYDAFMCYWFNGAVWTFSVYCDNGEVNCGQFCKQYFNGGGHKEAAGFTMTNEQFADFINPKVMIGHKALGG